MILLSLAIIIILGIIFARIFMKFRLPGLLGFLILGMIIGPYGLDLISPLLLELSHPIRLFALIVILLRAGLGIRIETIKKIGAKAFTLSCIPGLIEGFVILLVTTQLLDFTWQQGGILGFIVAAVSPAVVVPLMLRFQEEKIGTAKDIPTMILASASIEDVFIITVFSVFLTFETAGSVDFTQSLINVPIAIILGIVLGILLGWLLHKLFQRFEFRSTVKLLLVLAVAFVAYELEDILADVVSIASLLSVMFIGLTLIELDVKQGTQLKKGFKELWIFAEIVLFVFVGMIVDTSLALEAGFIGLIILICGLAARTVGVLLCLVGSNLVIKERLFVVFAFIPKATVQAAIGAIPLALGVPGGELILAISVLAILITAPLGSIGIQVGGRKLLPKPEDLASAPSVS